jgi:hypothetical protein
MLLPGSAQPPLNCSIGDADHLADLLVGVSDAVGELFQAELCHCLFGHGHTLGGRRLLRAPETRVALELSAEPGGR